MVADMFGRIQKRYDLTKKLKAEAKSLNKRAIDDIVNAEIDESMRKLGVKGSTIGMTYKEIKEAY